MGSRYVTLFSYGVLAAIIGITPVLLIVNASLINGFSVSETVSWAFGCYVFAGLIGIFLSWKTKLPICGSHSVPVAVLTGTALAPFTFAEAAGSYIFAGLCMLLLGWCGGFSKIVRFIPLEIVMAMFAGTMMHYAVGIVTITQQHLITGLAGFMGYLLFQRFMRSIPAPLGAILIGSIVAFMQGDLHSMEFGPLWVPSPFVPEFSLQGFISLSIPMVVLVLGTEGIQGISGLKLGGYDPPVDKMVMTSGLGTIFSGFFGGHSANTAGIMTTVCAGPEVGDCAERYKASIISGLFLLIFGFFASVFVPLIVSLPRYLIDLFTGYALMPILIQSLKISFRSSQFAFSAFATFVFSLSGVSFFGVHASFWSLLLGVLLVLLMERTNDKQVPEGKKRFASRQEKPNHTNQ